MSEEIQNSNDDQVRVIIEMEEGLVTNVHANKANVEVIVLETVTAETDPSDRTAVEYNDSTVEYAVTTYNPDVTKYDTGWEAAIVAGIKARAEEAAV